MPSSIKTARALLDNLVDADLIEVENHDEAIEALGQAIDGAASQERDLVTMIAGFLGDNDLVDEIYADDAELEAAIRRVLVAGSN